MELIENITKFTHKNMPSWGVGVFKKKEGAYVTVDFENVGIKTFEMNSIGTTLFIISESPDKPVVSSKSGV